MVYKYQCSTGKILCQTTKKDCQLFARINYSYDKAAEKYLTVKYFTDIRIGANKWDVKNQCAKKGMIGKPEFDLRITNAKEKIQKLFNGYVSTTGKEPEPETQKKLLFKEFTGETLQIETDKPKTFWGYFTGFH